MEDWEISNGKVLDCAKPIGLILRRRNNSCRARATMPVLNGCLNIVEAAEILSVHPGTVKRLCREGRLVAERVHNAWLIHNDVLHDFAKRCNGPRGRPSKKGRE